jgi:mannose-6-phosphate isomerase-like protein (cupin superfamily)
VIEQQCKPDLKEEQMVTLKVAEERKNGMHSVKGVLASLILVFGLLPCTAGIQAVDKEGLTADGTKRVIAAAVVKARRVNTANSLGAGTPAASSSFPATYFNAALYSEKIAGGGDYAGGAELLGWKDGENKYRVRVSVGHKEREFAQSHAFTHIFYIVEGSATFVTGGTIVDPKTVKQFSPEPGTGQEIRGTAIEGGETHHVSKGDVLITPRGVPHWWKEIQPGPFVYFVVQVS